VFSLPSIFKNEEPLARHVEGVAILVLFAACADLFFSVQRQPEIFWTHIPALAALFPLLLLIAARLPLIYAAIAVMIVTVVIVITTASGTGRFSRPDIPISLQLLTAQSIIISSAIIALALAALVAERRAAESKLKMLISELDHRVKNSLAMMQAMIERSQESAKSTDEFVASLVGRIRSLALTQSKLSRGQWQGVWLNELIENELLPYRTPGAGFVTGPPLKLKPSTAQAISIVMHELVTNAAKYGALSTPHGEVFVSWTFEDSPGDARGLTLEWREAGGPTVAAPGREGYGTSTIRELLPYEQNGKVTLRFDPRGVTCTIALPAACVVGASPEAGSNLH
jgi:two-component sensor histidine kinase